MAKKSKPIPKPILEKINVAPLEDIMGERYATYAKYVIQDRAIPDLRDGLKPVQRRIIYAMYHSNNVFRKPYRKSATSVGEVMGKYHPHGDASIYDALVHMSQPWKYRVPLIDFQGNNGSIDGDNAAAHRYTEVRLAQITEELVRDIDKNTVDTQLTFDDSQDEPVVLPARFPNLLVNGTQGIAVAMATNIPPHNLRDVIDAVIYRLGHKKATIEDLIDIVKGPDFPTGGTIYRTDSLKQIYLTGHGRVEILSKAEISKLKGYHQIVIKEIPYGVIKSALVKQMDEIRFKKIIDGIIEVRDESDHHGMRIAIDIREDANPEKILQYFYSKTDLKSSFSANMVAINKGHPITFNLLQYVDAYIDHQVEVITRLSNYDLVKASARLEIVEGLIKAIGILDEVVKVIRKSEDKQDAMTNLEKKFAFTKSQADAIVSLQLYRLTNTDVTTLKEEEKLLKATIKELKEILDDREVLNKKIIKDLKLIASQYGQNRLTKIVTEPKETLQIDKRDLIAKEDVYISVTRDGYIKRSPLKSYKSSEGVWPGIKEADLLVGVGPATTLDYVLVFTQLGNYLFIPIHELQETKWKDEGKHINYLVNLGPEEKLIKALIVSDFKPDAFVVMVTRNGQLKKTPLSEFMVQRYSKPLTCMRLLGDDTVVDVDITNGQGQLLIATLEGNVTYFSEKEVNPVGVKAGGVKAIASLLGKDRLAKLLVYQPEERGKIVMFTRQGNFRIFDVSYVDLTSRLGKVQYIFQSFKSEPHQLAYWRKLNKQDEFLKVTLLLSNKELVNLETNDYAPTPTDKYAKKNISMPKGTDVIGVYHDAITRIDNQYKTVALPKVNLENGDKIEKVSLFDDKK
ncbi:MAG: topoisomerase subunit [Bacillota bacterium]|jgi:topoisomerase-4 subunit A